MRHFTVGLLLLALILPLAAVAEPNDPKGVAAEFYEWYMTHEAKMPKALAERKGDFTPELYGKLMAAYKAEHVDFDPFVNAQSYAQHYLIGHVSVHGHKAEVPVALQLERNGSSSLTLIMTETPQQEWKIADAIYPGEGGVKDWTLLHFLQP